MGPLPAARHSVLQCGAIHGVSAVFSRCLHTTAHERGYPPPAGAWPLLRLLRLPVARCPSTRAQPDSSSTHTASHATIALVAMVSGAAHCRLGFVASWRLRWLRRLQPVRRTASSCNADVVFASCYNYFVLEDGKGAPILDVFVVVETMAMPGNVACCAQQATSKQATRHTGKPVPCPAGLLVTAAAAAAASLPAAAAWAGGRACRRAFEPTPRLSFLRAQQCCVGTAWMLVSTVFPRNSGLLLHRSAHSCSAGRSASRSRRTRGHLQDDRVP